MNFNNRYHGDFDHFVERLFLPGLVESGCFWAWTAGWWAAHKANPEAIHWVGYEDLKADPEGCIATVARFCAIPADAGVVKAVATGSSFDTMKRVFAEVDKGKLARGERVKKNHIRAGKKGGWRSMFSDALAEKFDRHHEKRCKELGLPDDLFDFCI